MKTIAIFPMILALFLLTATVVFSQFRFQDTSFLMRDVRNNYESYFIASIKDSIAYQDYLKQCMIENVPTRPTASGKQNVFSIMFFNQRLFQIQVYKKQFFLYRPSDNIESQYFYFSNKTILWEAAAEIDTLRIAEMTCTSDSLVINASSPIRTSVLFQFFQTPWPQILLMGKRVAQEHLTTWSLWIPERFIWQYPMIIHFSPTQKAFTEFECFETIEPEKFKKQSIFPIK